MEPVPVKTEAEDPARSPRLLQAPDVAWSLPDNSATTYPIKQEFVEYSDMYQGTGAKASNNVSQEHLVKQELKVELKDIKIEEEGNQLGDKWQNSSNEVAMRGGLYAGNAVKSEPMLAPELSQKPLRDWPRGETSVASCSIKQEFTDEKLIDNYTGIKTEASDRTNSDQDVIMQLKLEPETVKEEEEVEDWHGVSSAAARAGLYEGHAVKRELVLGPEVLQAPHVGSLRETNAKSCTLRERLVAEGASGECPEQGPRYKENQRKSCTVDNREKPYTCDICNKQFAQSSTLSTHKRIHTGEKPYKCLICDKRFGESGQLIRHRRIHTGEKPYKCDICHKRFKESGNLATHKRIHMKDKPYKCDFCNKQFVQAGSLVAHKRIHTGEKPFACDICDKRFIQSNQLLKHKRIHVGEKPKCDNCNKQFADSSVRKNCNCVKLKRIAPKSTDSQNSLPLPPILNPTESQLNTFPAVQVSNPTNSQLYILHVPQIPIATNPQAYTLPIIQIASSMNSQIYKHPS